MVIRTGKQCRERYRNHLCENLKKSDWTEEEDAIVLQLYDDFGPKWSKISSHIPGRSDNSTKNRLVHHPSLHWITIITIMIIVIVITISLFNFS